MFQSTSPTLMLPRVSCRQILKLQFKCMPPLFICTQYSVSLPVLGGSLFPEDTLPPETAFNLIQVIHTVSTVAVHVAEVDRSN
jgi:hypothetical protein